MTLDGPEHKELRKTLNPSMSKRQLDKYIPVFASLATEHLNRRSDGHAYSAAKDFKRLVYRQLAATLSSREGDDVYDDVHPQPIDLGELVRMFV
jgi:cytochrome P450